MADEFDDFGDVLGDNDDGGVFAGSGHRNFEGVRQSTRADGLKVELQCRLCGKPAAVVLEWAELFIIGTNSPTVPVLLPPEFQFSQSNRSAFTSLPCPRCGDKGLSIHVTPDEAARHVKDAVRSGFIPPAQVAHLQAYVRQRRGV